MEKQKKGPRGGKRESSGRKKAKYKTKVISFRVREELVEDVKSLVKTFIENTIKP